MRRTSTTRLAAVLAVAALAVGGCGGSGDDSDGVPDEVAESGPEDAANGDVDVEDGNVTADGKGANGPTDELPDDFPGDVPLLDGAIRSAGGQSDDSGGQLWLVQMSVEGDPDSVFGDAVDLLEGAGYEQDLDMDGTIGTWSNGTWEVGLAVIDADGSVMAQYSVTPSPE